MTAMLLLGLPRMPDRGGAPRYDLHGSVSGEVSTEEAAHAAGGPSPGEAGRLHAAAARPGAQSRPQAPASPACDPGNGLSRHGASTRCSPLAVTTRLSRKCVYGRSIPRTPTSGKARQHARAGCPGDCATQGRPILHPLIRANPSADNGAAGDFDQSVDGRAQWPHHARVPGG